VEVFLHSCYIIFIASEVNPCSGTKYCYMYCWVFAINRSILPKGMWYFQRGWVRMVWNREWCCAWSVVRDAQHEELSKCEQLTSEVYKNLWRSAWAHNQVVSAESGLVISKSMAGEISINTFIYSPFSSSWLKAPLRGFIWTHTTISYECSRDCTEANWDLGINVCRYHRQIESQRAKSEGVVWTYGMVQTTTESVLWVLWW
jgi:hypothetical protein